MTTSRRRWAAAAAVALVFAGGCNSSSEAFEPTIKAANECVKPGEDVTIVVSNAEKAEVALLLQYPNGATRPDQTQPRGVANDNGEFRGTYTMPTDAPAGEATVRAAVAAGPNATQLTSTFAIADASGSCAAPTAAAAATTTQPSTVPGQTASPGQTTTTSASAASTTTTIRIVEGGDFETKVTVSKQCLDPGDQQTIKIETMSRTALTYVVAYAPGSPGGDSNAGTANADGQYTDTFKVRADAKPGIATVQVSVQASQGRRSFAGVRFQVGDC